MVFGRSGTMASRTSTSLTRAALAVALLCVVAPAGAEPAPPGIDAYVAHAMKAFGPPGLSLAVVENGKVVVAKGYGVRKMNTTETVDAHTAFPIGSESKAFTSAAL